MIANASRNCCSLMQSGGLVIERVPAHQSVKPFLAEELASAAISGEVPLKGAIGSRRLPIAHQLDDPEQSDVTRRAHRRMPGLQIREQLLHYRAHLARVFDQVDLLRKRAMVASAAAQPSGWLL